MLSLSTVNDMGMLDLQASCSVQYLSAKNPSSLSLINKCIQRYNLRTTMENWICVYITVN